VRFPPSSALANNSPLQDLADKVARLCGAQRLALTLDDAAADMDLTPSSERFVRLFLISALTSILFF
jgi:hypothetical protein